MKTDAMKLETKERQALDRLLLIFEEFRKINPEMPLQQAISLVSVALEPGIAFRDLSNKTGIIPASITRHMEVFGPDLRPHKNVGADLVSITTDFEDRRVKRATLTTSGLRMIRSLIHLMQK